MKLSESEHFSIRYTTIDDVFYLRKWLLDPEISKYIPYRSEEEVFFYSKYWMSSMNKKSAITATYKDKPIGMAVLYLMLYKKIQHSALSSMIVSPDYFKRGVGNALLKNLVHLGKEYLNLELIQMEIYEQKGLHALLLKEGFYEVFRQKHFVKMDNQYHHRIFMEKVT